MIHLMASKNGAETTGGKTHTARHAPELVHV